MIFFFFTDNVRVEFYKLFPIVIIRQDLWDTYTTNKAAIKI